MMKIHETVKKAGKKVRDNFINITPYSRRSMIDRCADTLPIQTQHNGYSEIKAKLITRFSDKSIKTIMFTSTAHGNGSSFTAVSFAMSLTRDSQHNVLIVDANLRYPRIHEIFNIERRAGVSNLLTEVENSTSFVKKIGQDGLYLITCGDDDSEPINLFESPRFERMLQVTGRKYDYVILDTPPVNSYSESIVIASRVDGVILVLESDKTRQQVALRAKEEMEKAGANILGVILNKRKHYIPECIYKRL